MHLEVKLAPLGVVFVKNLGYRRVIMSRSDIHALVWQSNEVVCCQEQMID